MKIFISYAHGDGIKLASKVSRDLAARGHDVWIDHQRLSAGAIWTRELEGALDAADVVLALLSAEAHRSDVCRAEQLRSLRRGKRLIPILLQADVDRPLHLEPFQHRDFSDPRHYKRRLEELLGDLESRRTATVPDQYRATLVTAPPLPINHIPRLQELEALRRIVVAENASRHVGITGLRGMGGIGKTMLAQALCHDEAVQAAFPDGVIWITVGQSPREPLALLAEVGGMLGDSASEYSSVPAAASRLRRLLADRSVLLVLDDVWDARHVEPFRADSASSRILFTTRNGDVVDALGATEYAVDLLTREQALKMLGRWSGTPVHALPAEAVDVVYECGRLPLAVAMIGASMRRKPSSRWRDMLQSLRATDLEVVRQQFPDYPYPSVLRAIEVSVDYLPPKTREMYKALCVLPEDVGIPEAALSVLWAVEPLESAPVVDSMLDLSLATRNTNGSISIHDVQLMYLKQKMRSEMADMHGQLVDRYSRMANGAWSSGPDDGYFFQQLTWHLARAGRQDELARVLFDPTWYFAKLRACDGPSLVADFEAAAEDPATSRVQRAVRLSLRAIADDRRSLVQQLIARLLDDDDTRVQEMLARATTLMTGTWLRPLTASLHTASSAIIQTFQSNGARDTSAALSFDGRRAFHGSTDGKVRVWDTVTGAPLRVLDCHTGAVTALACSADGRRCVSAGSDKSVCVWDVDAGARLMEIQARAATLAMSGNGTTVLWMSNRAEVIVWDLSQKCAIARFRTRASYTPPCIAVSQDGRAALRAAGTDKVWLFDPRSPKPGRILDDDHMRVASLSLSADGSRAAVSSYDSYVRVWDTRKRLQVAELHVGKPTAVALQADGRTCVVARTDLKVIDSDTGVVTRVLSGDARSIRSLSLAGDGSKAVTASAAGVALWDLTGRHPARSASAHGDSVRALDVSSNGTLAVSGSRDGTVALWDVGTGTIRSDANTGSSVTAVLIMAAEKAALLGHQNGRLTIWNFQTSKLTTVGYLRGSIRGLGHVDHEDNIVVAFLNGRIAFWSYAGRSVSREVSGTPNILAVAVSNRARKALVARTGAEIDVRSTDGSLEGSLHGHLGRVSSVALLNDGSRALSGGMDGTSQLWNLETRSNIMRVKGPWGPLTAVDASRDGKFVASGSHGGTVAIWSDRLQELASFTATPELCAASSVGTVEQSSRAITSATYTSCESSRSDRSTPPALRTVNKAPSRHSARCRDLRASVGALTRVVLDRLQRRSETSVARRREAACREQVIAEQHNDGQLFSCVVAFVRRSPALRPDRLRRSVVRPPEATLRVFVPL